MANHQQLLNKNKKRSAKKMTRPKGFVCVCCCFFKMLSLLIFWSWNMLPFWEAHPKNDDDAYWFCVCMSVYTWLSVYLCWCVISQCCLLKDHVDFLIKCVAYWNLLPFWEAHPKNDDDAYRFCVCMYVCVCCCLSYTTAYLFISVKHSGMVLYVQLGLEIVRWTKLLCNQ